MTTAAENRKKPRGKPFAPGNSANPGGRPKKTPEEFELVEACKAKTKDALDVIEQIMRHGQSEKTRLSAAVVIIERAYGKPTQDTNTTLAGEIGIRGIRVEFVDAGKP